MARFSAPAEHGDRRRAVVDAIGAIETERAHGFAAEQAAARLTGAPIDGIEIAGTVPTEAITRCLDLRAPLGEVVADVLAIVRVIGRGVPSTSESDAATERMLALCGVPQLSILYQNFDATWARLTTRSTVAAGRPLNPTTSRNAGGVGFQTCVMPA
jgi:hypothetical protein